MVTPIEENDQYMVNDDKERKIRLSNLCKKLRGKQSMRSFTGENSDKLKGISHASWSAWEGERAGLSADSLERLVSFINCSHQSFYAYLDGLISLEELLQPLPKNKIEADEERILSPHASAGWMQSLSAEDQLLLVSQGFHLLQGKIDKLVDDRSNEKIQILMNLLFGSNYPQKSQIEDAAQKLNIPVDDLNKLCDRVFGRT